MYRSDLDSMFAEACALPTRLPYQSLWKSRPSENFYGSTSYGIPMIRVWQGSGDYWNDVDMLAKRTGKLFVSSQGVKGIYVTLSDLLGLASLGIQSAKEMGACFSSSPFGLVNAEKFSAANVPLGNRIRTLDGKRYVRYAAKDVWPDKHTVGDAREWQPTCRPYTIGTWKNISYPIDTIKFYAAEEKPNVISISGNNQYFRVANLDSLLGVELTRKSNAPYGSIAITDYNGKVRYTNNGYYPYLTQASQYIVRSLPVDLFAAPSEDDIKGKKITARAYLTDESGEQQEVFTETVQYCGVLYLTRGLWTELKTDEKGRYVNSVYKYSGIVLYFTPADFWEWHTANSSYETVPRAWELLKSFPYTAPWADELEVACGAKVAVYGEATPLYNVTKSANTVLLQAGRQYSLSIAVDNLYTPLTLTSIPTIQANLYPVPIKVEQ